MSIAVAAVVLLSLGLGGCAYFNTLYNAKATFREAEAQPLDREGKVSRSAEQQYEQVIAKCHKMIETWPDSRHVDDARLLIARSYFGAERYENAVAAADTLITLHPKTNLMNKALALKGIALARDGQHEQAVDVLKDRYQRFGPTPEVLYSLSTSLMSVDRSDEAVKYLEIMEDKYPNDSETFDAQVAVAEILAEKDQLEESRAVYERLTSERIPEDFRYRVWMGSADVNLRLERYGDALANLEQVDELVLTPDEEPPMLLDRARAYAGADSVEAAVKTYKDVAARFSRGEFAAEAHYRLGQIYEAQDSVETARDQYRSVSQAYANSDFSPEAVRKANDLSKLLKLQAAADDNSPEAQALRTFSMAELQLFQFENVDKALASYQEILQKYPDTDFAPKAAYAVGYIYGIVKNDSARAWESYDFIMDRYPRSQQAAYANRIVAAYGGAPSAGVWTPPVDTTRVAPPDTLQRGTASADSLRRRMPPDTLRGVAPADTTTRRMTPADTTRTRVKTDTTRTRTRVDSTRAPADTTSRKGSG